MEQASEGIGTSWVGRRLEAFNSVSHVGKAYAVGMLLCAIGILVPASDGAQALSGPFLWAGGLFLVAALTREAYVIVSPHVQSAWSKALMVPVAVMVGAYSLGSGANIVNAATGQNPDLFPRATAFMAPIAAIPAFALLVTVLAGAALLIMSLAWINEISSKNKSKGGRAWLWLGRIAAALATMSLVSPAFLAESGFGQGIEKVAGWMAHGLDMHTDSTCGAGEWSRVARINDELVVVARKAESGLVFRREQCSLNAE